MMHEIEISAHLEKLKRQHLLRTLSTNSGKDFSSNDYLSLSNNPESLQAGIQAAKIWGTGSTGSRLLSGNKPIFETFEEQIARDKQSESALIFNSGYVANLSVMTAFTQLGYCIIFDKLNHASMYPGVPLKQLQRFRHLDYLHLDFILQKCHKNYPKLLIASETVFGMDGDKANIQTLSNLTEKYGALLYLDEAHASGLYGKQGYGLSTDIHLNPKTTLVMGTFSKALASCGAYVACSQLIKEYLIQVSKGFIYSTALPPFDIGVAAHNWEKLPALNSVRKDIFAKAAYTRKQLTTLGYKLTGKGTNILSILFPSIEEMLIKHKKLINKGFFVSAIRPPTSPTPRLRLALNASHTYDDIDALIEVLA